MKKAKHYSGFTAAKRIPDERTPEQMDFQPGDFSVNRSYIKNTADDWLALISCTFFWLFLFAVHSLGPVTSW